MIFGKNQSIVAAFPRMPNDDDKKGILPFYAAIFEMEVDGRFLPLLMECVFLCVYAWWLAIDAFPLFFALSLDFIGQCRLRKYLLKKTRIVDGINEKFNQQILRF